MGATSSKAALSTAVKGCTLWKADRSPACRAVMMALDALNLNIKEVDVDMDKGEHKSPKLSVINPFQTLPIFQDQDLTLHDSNAICVYLASRYGANSRLYPQDVGQQALIHQHMFYNCNVLYPCYRAAVDPILYENYNYVMPQLACDIECAYADLEKLLGSQNWFGGNWPTLADITLGSTVSTLNCLVPIDALRYPVLSSWFCRLSEQNFYVTANKKGLDEFTKRIGELAQIQKT